MQYVLCYDIADAGRREHAASLLLDFGSRVQESVFVANLDDTHAARMREKLHKVIDEDHDRVHIFVLCAGCAARTTIIGSAEVPADRDFYVI
jgi:CRISPR-associated protein Cas2